MSLKGEFRNKGYLKSLLLAMEHVAKDHGLQTISASDIKNPFVIEVLQG